MKRANFKNILLAITVAVTASCSLISPTEFDDSEMVRPDKELTAREIISGKYPTVAVWNPGSGNFVDREIFVTFDSLLNMYPEYENIFTSTDTKKTFLIPTNWAFNTFYKAHGQKEGFVGSGNRKYFKLADIPDSTRRNIILNSVLETPVHTRDLTDVLVNYLTMKGVNITLKTNSYGVLEIGGIYPYNNDASGRKGNYNVYATSRTSNLEPKNGIFHAFDVIPFMDERNFSIGSTFVPLQ